MNRFHVFYISLNILFVLPIRASVEIYTPKPYWLSIGVGLSSEGFTPGVGISRAILGGAGIIRIAMTSNGSSVDPANGSNDSNLDEAFMLGFLYGPKYENRPLLFSVALGPAWTWGRIDEFNGIRYREKDFSLPSLVIEIQRLMAAYKALNFGIIGFGNVNEEQSIWGILAGIGLH